MRTKRSQFATASLLAVASLSVVCMDEVADRPFSQRGKEKVTAFAERTKVAEGEYAVLEGANRGGVGPFGEEVCLPRFIDAGGSND